jgi:hypothetical protein
MIYKGSCHCGKIAFEAEGELEQVIACNCSICSKRGSLLWIVPPANFHLLTPVENYATYTFYKHKIKHRFCSKCGCAPFEEGIDLNGNANVGINMRCLDGVDLSAINVRNFNGRDL